MILSIDIETYGAAKQDHLGRMLPRQKETKSNGRMHPMRSLAVDRIPLSSQILTVSVTEASSSFEPLTTRIFYPHLPDHRRWLRLWLSRATTLVGFNLPFDLLYLRCCGFAAVLPPFRARLIDASILNYLDDDTRPERSLKDLGRLFNLFTYTLTPRDDYRFASTLDPLLSSYNAQDTHNTLLLVRHFLARPSLSHLTPAHLDWWSRMLWCSVSLSSAGLPMSSSALLSLRSTLEAEVAHSLSVLSLHGLVPEGEGSQKSKYAFIDSLLSLLPFSIYDHPLLQTTEKKGRICCDINNLLLIREHLDPAKHGPQLDAISALLSYTHASKLLSSFVLPLLGPKPDSDPPDYSSTCFPRDDSGVVFGWPSWYITPSPYKDGDGPSGGQKQARPSAKNPALQTFPPPVKACLTSRHRDGVICSADASQIELRVAAVLSGEESILSTYRSGADLHSARAIALIPDAESWPGWKSGDMTIDPRQWGKQFNFADLNLASASALQRLILRRAGRIIPFSLCSAAVSSRASLRPSLTAWQQSLWRTVVSTGIITLPFTGHRRRFTPGDDRLIHEIVNFPIQAHAAVVTEEMQMWLTPRLPSSIHLFANVYDALYFDCPSRLVPSLRSLIDEGLAYLTSSSGYWTRLCEHYGHHCPLLYAFH